ncbi:hypothetical protein X943_002186 [Babesia divergens]|uniref:Uncharacterized protein n=1 Tax=Babesia divergens TaxID=32595 RepID=A0AAD9LK51_BABDI|nr:hypothetical protein X943_002186 [Babesia divergens]
MESNAECAIAGSVDTFDLPIKATSNRYHLSPCAREYMSECETSVKCCRFCHLVLSSSATAAHPDEPNSRWSSITASDISPRKPRLQESADNDDGVSSNGDMCASSQVDNEKNCMSSGRMGCSLDGNPSSGINGTKMLSCCHTSKSINRFETKEQQYRFALEWLGRTMKHLNNLENLGYGQVFRQTQLHHLRYMETSADNNSGDVQTVAKVLHGWIKFDSEFRRIYNVICKTYHRLLRNEVYMNLLRTNSLHMLETGELGSNATHVTDSLPPKDSIRQSELYGKLVSIWYTKLSELRCRNIREFRQYVLDAVSDLIDQSAPRAWVFVQDIEPISLLLNDVNLDNSSSKTVATAAASFGLSDADSSSCDGDARDAALHSVDSHITNAANSRDEPPVLSYSTGDVIEYVLETADAAAEYCEDEEIDDYEAIYEEAVQIMNQYCEKRGISEEGSLEYVNRVSDLSNRLLPRFLNVTEKMPVYNDSFHDCFLGYIRHPSSEGSFMLNSGSCGAFDHVARASDADRTSKGSSPSFIRRPSDLKLGVRAEGGYDPEMSRWFSRNRFVSLLYRTNLTVIDAVRLTPLDSSAPRKLVVFTRGDLKDLFLNGGGTHATENIDLSSIIRSESLDTVLDESSCDSEFQPTRHSRNGSRNLMRALLNEDLAADEIDNVVSRWFPTLVWNGPAVKGDATEEAEDYTCISDGWYPSAAITPLTGDIATLQRDTWLSRLRLFNSFTSRHLHRLHGERTGVEPRIKYDSGGYASLHDFRPLRAMCDFANHIPIRYTIKSQSHQGDGPNGWIQSLFGVEPYDSKIACDAIKTNEGDQYTFPLDGMHCGINAVVVPIHRRAAEHSDSYRMISDICDCLTDYIYPPLYDQHAFMCQGLGSSENSSATCSTHSSGRDIEYMATDAEDFASRPIDTCCIGKVFVSRHSSLCIEPLCNPESTERILAQIEHMRNVMDGIDCILRLCEKWKVVTLSLPATLRCCSPANAMTEREPPNSNGGTTTTMPIGTYMRCLATATHLSTSLCRGTFPVAVNMIFPDEVCDTDIERNLASIFTNRVGAF